MSKEKTIEKLLKASDPIQLARVRAVLEGKSAQWCTKFTPQEYQLSLKALAAFDKGNYSDAHIARYLSPAVIEKIYGE